MTSVLVLGQPFWGSYIARILDTHALVDARFVPQREYALTLARSRRSRVDVIMRAGYRAGATTLRGRMFDRYWSLLRRALPDALRCHYWLGSDVSDTIDEARAGTLRWRALRSTARDLHLATAPWLVEELGTVGVPATTAVLPDVKPLPSEVAPLPTEFAVLTYIAGDRFDFYGGPVILEAASRLPQVRFDIVGSRRRADRLGPANVLWHGWVDDMASYYARSSVIVRIHHHDGFGGTVIEGLVHARHVLYTHDVPHVRTVQPTVESIIPVLQELYEAHARGELRANLEGRAYALDTFDNDRLTAHLVGLLRAAA